ncbi:T9SS type A sorting domain-containing protein [uncultured Pontibacter sp.]|uniref:T9SS type A sorting domain-containing protein n=1 Tax=uncultured Pontibacter sp. TaxID=453356 RepID=UPI0026089388|nr:T9SS type A sorting domain-containing protein [uncultured Pontibacter sp.]
MQDFESKPENMLPTKKAVYPYTGAGMSSKWVNGTLSAPSTIPGWYLGVENQNIREVYFIGNDSSFTDPVATAFSYGSNGSTERSVGYKGQLGQYGVFYAALRMKNNSTQIIKNFDVSFAVEQWYYGGEVTDVHLEYAIGPNVISATTTSVTWYPIDRIATPVSEGLPRSMNGNRAENRVSKTFTLSDINIPVGQEIVFRWALKITSNHTKFNGVALDDVTVRPHGVGGAEDIPETKAITYYNIPGKPLDDTRSWGTDQNGSGTHPRNFTDPQQTFMIKNMPPVKTDGKKKKFREDDYTLSIKSKDGWVVSGEGSKVVLGDGVNPLKVAFHKDKFYDGPLDISANATLVINTDKKDKNAVPKILPTFGSLHPTSTVVYSDSTDLDIVNTAYGNLVILGNEYSKSHIKYNNLAESLTIKGQMQLEGKKLKLADKTLTISETGTLLNADTSSYIIADGTGALSKVAAAGVQSEVVFPVGTSKEYAPLKIISNSSNPVTYNVSVKENVNNPLNHTGSTQRTATNKTWIIEKEQVDGTSSATIVLQWRGKATEVYELDKMFVGRFNEEGKWQIKKASAYSFNSTTNMHELTLTDDFSAASTTAPLGSSAQSGNSLRLGSTPQTMASQGSGRTEIAVFTNMQPFPVELVSFTALHSKGETSLLWKTASEKDNSHFEVEVGYSLDSFTKIGEVKGRGNSSVLVNYSYKHKPVMEGIVYYRLKQVDLSGETNYSNIVAVEAKRYEHQQLMASPNPTSGKVTVQLPSAASHTLTVMSITGNVIESRAIPAGSELISLDLSRYADGAYVLRLQSNDDIRSYKLIKN